MSDILFPVWCRICKKSISNISLEDINYTINLPTCSICGNYSLKRTLIGKGAFGKVYLASHLSKEMVFKEIHLRKNVKIDVHNIKNELKILNYLKDHSSPYIVKSIIVPTFNNNWNFYRIGLEYCNQGSLSSYLKFLKLNSQTFEGFSEVYAINLVKQLCCGIHFIHNHGIIHCDIKSANILINRPSLNMNETHLKISDFGGSCFLENDQSLLIWDTKMHFTPCIRPPELYLDENTSTPIKIDKNADMWGVGCVIWEILVHLKTVINAIKTLDESEFKSYLKVIYNPLFDLPADKEKYKSHIDEYLPPGCDVQKRLVEKFRFLGPEYVPSKYIEFLARFLERDPEKRIDYLGIEKYLTEKPIIKRKLTENNNLTSGVKKIKI